eukprot:CAMPEP_0202810656 /NCGR_PEP_ID=MMETSP1389-20130828/2703_1 /ASSEMBLY_ACC=CAM_ASM_000865 /TAXON_ID=302021 /ORGANISM="Rhodomonas sp., Strain CCMP768" /LENGTH=166 /DNA_ID=CAMNT_0049481587 /DNA_START=80 /DNA_END=576 /DNA_ORIENTATION=+
MSAWNLERTAHSVPIHSSSRSSSPIARTDNPLRLAMRVGTQAPPNEEAVAGQRTARRFSGQSSVANRLEIFCQTSHPTDARVPNGNSAQGALQASSLRTGGGRVVSPFVRASSLGIEAEQLLQLCNEDAHVPSPVAQRRHSPARGRRVRRHLSMVEGEAWARGGMG